MGHTCNSIIINAPYEKVFDISNDIPRWTELFGGEYKKAEVVKKEGNSWKIYLSELNTIPGFTSISMYPKLWAASGVYYKKLLDILIRLAIERHHEKNALSTTYKTSGWYK